MRTDVVLLLVMMALIFKHYTLIIQLHILMHFILLHLLSFMPLALNLNIGNNVMLVTMV